MLRFFPHWGNLELTYQDGFYAVTRRGGASLSNHHDAAAPQVANRDLLSQSLISGSCEVPAPVRIVVA